MKQSAARSTAAMACLPACLMVVVFLTGCAEESQTVSGSQEIAKAPPPPPPPAPEPPLPPPPPPPVQEMAPEPAAAPADPLAWAAGLADVHFAYNQSKIRKENKPDLDALAQKLKEDSARKVLVEGHCDSRGTANYNMMLGERRAKSVRQYLLKAGVAESQIDVVSYGKEKPLCMEMTDECWQSNRRAHFQPQ